MNSRSHRRANLFLRAALATLVVMGTPACFGDDGSDRADDPNVAVDSADTESETEATGSLVLGSDTIAFAVDDCDLAAEPPSRRATLSGHADLPDGRTLHVTILRTPMESTTWHSIGLDFGSEYREARRGRFEGEGGWRSITADSMEPGLGPLITIEGRGVSARGTFSPGSGEADEPVPGNVTATCPES